MAFFSSCPRIAVIGAGIIGLSAAYELAVRRGARVTIFDVRPPGRGASWAAAGMLAPAFEAAAEPGVHPQLFELCLELLLLLLSQLGDSRRSATSEHDRLERGHSSLLMDVVSALHARPVATG